MNPLITMLNHLIVEALQGQVPGGGLSVRALVLDAQGMRLVAQLNQGDWQGEAVLRIDAEAGGEGAKGEGTGGQQILHLRVESLPAGIPPAWASFRRLVETAKLRLELDFSQ